MSTIIKVALSAGHGGTDRANVGPHGYVEADRMLVLSKLLLAEFQRQPNFKVMNIRETDTYIDLYSRCKKAAAFGADLILDLHTNAATPTVGFGSEVIHITKNTADKQVSVKIATALALKFNTTNRGAKTRLQANGTEYYGMLRHAVTLGIKRSFIIESLFHDKEREAKILMDDANLKIIAQIICQEFCADYGFTYVKEGVTKPVENPVKPVEPTPTDISSWAVKSRDYLKSIGLTDGTNPKGTVTREQVWKMIASAIIFVLKTIDAGKGNSWAKNLPDLDK